MALWILLMKRVLHQNNSNLLWLRKNMFIIHSSCEISTLSYLNLSTLLILLIDSPESLLNGHLLLWEYSN